MSNHRDCDEAFYEIRVRGRLEPWWEEVFDGMSVLPGKDVTTISGVVADQAALHGLLARVRDLGLVLVSVKAGEDDTQFF